MPNYSIIIPHRNIPRLLQRCIDSIPLREDLEIIIVDDNSDSTIVDFVNFPGQTRRNTKVIFTKEGKGAGYARNVGIQHASGTWIIFADADDYFTENFPEILDKYLLSKADIIYFKPTSTEYINNGKESERVKTYRQLFDGNERFLRYAYITPWGKFIKREYIKCNGFLFDEIRWGNDAYFMTQVGITTQNFEITTDCIYVVEEREGSLTREKGNNHQEKISRILTDIKIYKYAEKIGFALIDTLLFSKCLTLLKNKEYYLLMQTIKTLPKTARKSIKKRLLHKINLHGRVIINTLFFLSRTVPRLT